jgi:excisionase family DNA binding protein
METNWKCPPGAIRCRRGCWKSADRHALISTKEAARVLDVHVETLGRAVADGRIEAVRLRERGWMRFRRSDLARLLGEAPTAEQQEARIAALEAKLAAEQRALALDWLASVADAEEAA